MFGMMKSGIGLFWLVVLACDASLRNALDGVAFSVKSAKSVYV